MKKTVLGVAAVLLTYSCLPAQASEVLAQSSVEVRVGDLDLAKASDMSTLYGRLRIAALSLRNDAGKTLSFGNGLAGYALGRSTASWTVPRSGFTASGAVSVKAQSDGGPVSAVASIAH